MGKLATISVKVPLELREKLRKYGIRPSEVVRRALEEAVREAELRMLEERLRELRGVLSKIPPEEIARSIREDREAR